MLLMKVSIFQQYLTDLEWFFGLKVNLVENILYFEFFFLSFSNVNFAYRMYISRRRNCCKYVSFTLTFFCCYSCNAVTLVAFGAKSPILYHHTFYLNIFVKNLQQEGRRHFATVFQFLLSTSSLLQSYAVSHEHFSKNR